MRAEEEAMNQGPVIPGFGPDDGPPSRFPMPGPPPDISYGREPSPEHRDDFMEDRMGPPVFVGKKGPSQIRGGRDRNAERGDFDVHMEEREDRFDHEMERQRHSRMDDLPPFGRGPGGPRHPGRGSQMHHDMDDSRHPERDGPRHHDIDGPKRHDLDGPRHHDLDGPRRRDMDGSRRREGGPRRHDNDGPRHSDVDDPREFEMDGARFRGMDGPPPDRSAPPRGGPPKKSSGPVPLMSLVLDPIEPPAPRPSRGSRPTPDKPPPPQPKRASTPPDEGPKPLIPGLTPEALRRGDISLDDLGPGPGPSNLPPNHKKNEIKRGDPSDIDFKRGYHEDVDYRQPPRGGPPKGGPMADRDSSDLHGPPFSLEHSSSPAAFNRSGPSSAREGAPSGRGRGGLVNPSPTRGRGGTRQGPDRFTSQGGPHGAKFDRQDDHHISKDLDMRVPHPGGQSQDKDSRQTSGGPLRNQNTRGGYHSSTLDRPSGNIMGKSSFDQTLRNRDNQMERKDFTRDEVFQDNREFVQSKTIVSPRGPTGHTLQKDELSDTKELPSLARPPKRLRSEEGEQLFSSNPMRGTSGGRGRGQRGRGGARGGGARGAGARGRGGRSRGRGRGRGGW